jgi:hypothetical protein
MYSFRHGIYSNSLGNANAHVWGNYIGTHADGFTCTFNEGSGVFVVGSTNAFFGANGDITSDANEGSVISSFEFGVQLSKCEGLLGAGNYAGTEKTGTIALGNDWPGGEVVTRVSH